MLKANKVREKLAGGDVCYGTMLRILQSPQAITMCAAAGWDYVIVDTEHCDFDFETLAAMAMVAKYEEVVLLVRVPDRLYHQLARPLDIGAEGLIIPRVETPDEVKHIIESTKYYPLGRRGASVSSISTRFRQHDAAEFLEWSNRETLIIIQIESQTAVDHIDDLVSIAGVNGVMIGPFDLSQSMGIPGQLQHPRMMEAYQQIIEACNRHQVAPGIHLQNLDAVSKWVNAGMRFMTYQYDVKIMTDASRAALSELRAIPVG